MDLLFLVQQDVETCLLIDSKIDEFRRVRDGLSTSFVTEITTKHLHNASP
jgi:hypothetical protein